MSELKIINDLESAKYQAYLSFMKENASFINNPIVFEFNEKIYVAAQTEIENIYMIATTENKSFKILGACLKNDELNEVVIGDYIYYYINNNVNHGVSRKSSIDFTGELFFRNENEIGNYYHYIQTSEDDKVNLQLIYDVSNHPEAIYLSHITNKKADKVIIEDHILFPITKYFIKKDKQYINHIKVPTKNIYIPNLFNVTYQEDDFYSKLKESGYQTIIPQELIDIYSEQNEDYNSVKTITNNYKQLIKTK